jgi:Leucine-rich repeat (LRR) protein
MALNNLSKLVVFDSPLREMSFKRDSLVECMLGLTELWLVSTRISEIAFGKGICPNLQHLYIYDCKGLAEVGTLPDTLMELELWDCLDLENIEAFCGLAKLQMLTILNCPKVEQFFGLGTLKSLDTLELYKCGVTGILGLQQLTKLRVLKVSSCNALEELAGIEHLM